MKEYLLLFRGGNSNEINPSNPAAWQEHMMKWMQWMEELGKAGQFVSGQPLAKSGSTISGSTKKVTDGPFAEGKEIVGGYLMIKAGSQEEAVKLSMGCPILETDGTVEIRKIEDLGSM